MKHICHCLFTSACFLLFVANASAQNDTTITKSDTAIVKNDTTIVKNDTTIVQPGTTIIYQDSMRGQRYCEVVLVKVSLPNIAVTVYNTLGLNACPEEQWKNINTDELKKQFGVHTVVANGPRFYLVDKIALYNNDLPAVAFDSLLMRQWTKMRMGINMAMSLKKGETYKERPFKMNTEKTFNKGSTVFELASPDHTYIMESYSQEVDSTLSEAGLPNLQQRLALPAGWAYKVVTLDDDLRLVTVAGKEAFGLEDELGDRYQRIE